MRRGLPAILALAAALAAAAPSGARACMNAVFEADEVIASFKEAERRLNDGDPAEARALMSKVIDTISLVERHLPSESGLHDRAARVLALADVRLDPPGHATGKRRATLEHAVEALEKLAEARPNDPA